MPGSMKADEFRERVATAERGYVLEDRGLLWTDTGKVSGEVWRDVGRELARVGDRGLWALGDWLALGVERGYDGPSFERAIAVTGYSRSHLSRALAQAEAWPREARVTAWSVLNQIRRLPDRLRDTAVALACQEGWTTDRTEEYVTARLMELERPPQTVGERSLHAWRNPGRRRGGRVSPASAETFARQVTCPNCQHRFTP